MRWNVDIVEIVGRFIGWFNSNQGHERVHMQDMIAEIKHLKKIANDWQQTAEMLAIDLGDVKIAMETYTDIKDGLYDKVRERIKSHYSADEEDAWWQAIR
jgi:hypothetical protein